jgi:arylsulfatase A-like enzyme
VDRLDDAETDFDPVQFRSVRKDGLLSSPVTLAGETRTSLTPPLPSRLTYQVDVPPDPILSFSIGATPLGDGPLAAAVDFLVYVDPPGNEDPIFSGTLQRHQSNQWMARSVDLSPWSGQRVALTFETKTRTAESVQQPILAAWGDPVLAGSPAKLGELAKPNLILISIDCLRSDHLGTYGYERNTSPNLDRFAEDGVVFETAVSTSSWTLPTHMSMMTGLMPSFHRATKWEKLDRSVPYLPEILADHGYQATGVASWVYVSQVYGFERGFDVYRVLEDPTARDVIDAAIEQLRVKKGQNHFLFMHLLDPHWPYLPPNDFLERFGPRPRDISDLQDLILHAEPPPSETERDEIIRLYDGEIAFTDQELGRFFEELKALGLYDHSLVIVTADHGEAFYEHGHWQHSQTLYEEIIRIPMIVKWPGDSLKGRIRAQVSQVDVFPSVLQAAGIEPPATEFVSLRELVDAERRVSEERVVMSEVTWRSPNETSMKVSFRTERMKFLATLAGPVGDDLGVSETRQEELYDLVADPDERTNLAAERSEELASFQGRLRSFIDGARAQRSTRPGQQIELDEELLERLRALGYVDH